MLRRPIASVTSTAGSSLPPPAGCSPSTNKDRNAEQGLCSSTASVAPTVGGSFPFAWRWRAVRQTAHRSPDPPTYRRGLADFRAASSYRSATNPARSLLPRDSPRAEPHVQSRHPTPASGSRADSIGTQTHAAYSAHSARGSRAAPELEARWPAPSQRGACTPRQMGNDSPLEHLGLRSLRAHGGRRRRWSREHHSAH